MCGEGDEGDGGDTGELVREMVLVMVGEDCCVEEEKVVGFLEE